MFDLSIARALIAHAEGKLIDGVPVSVDCLTFADWATGWRKEVHLVKYADSCVGISYKVVFNSSRGEFNVCRYNSGALRALSEVDQFDPEWSVTVDEALARGWVGRFHYDSHPLTLDALSLAWGVPSGELLAVAYEEAQELSRRDWLEETIEDHLVDCATAAQSGDFGNGTRCTVDATAHPWALHVSKELASALGESLKSEGAA
jgi:hypothetical protein